MYELCRCDSSMLFYSITYGYIYFDVDYSFSFSSSLICVVDIVFNWDFIFWRVGSTLFQPGGILCLIAQLFWNNKIALQPNSVSHQAWMQTLSFRLSVIFLLKINYAFMAKRLNLNYVFNAHRTMYLSSCCY